MLLFIGLSHSVASELTLPKLSSEQLNQLALKIEKNETAGQKNYLTYWSKNEPFPSFGIGHFIWLPHNSNLPFKQTFPAMLAYVKQYKPAPYWLENLHPLQMPWLNRKEFYKTFNDQKLTSLRTWLYQTKDKQAEFIYQQFLNNIQQKRTQLSSEQKKLFDKNFTKILQAKNGVYALVDYSNFKGLGFNAKEQYQGKGWGLVEVILAMDTALIKDQGILFSFIDSGKQRLKIRTELAPESKNEQRWIPGWFNRLDSYSTENQN